MFEELDASGHMTGQLLIAMPNMADPRFARTVIYLCAHSDEGAMGLVINKPMPQITFVDLLEQLEIETQGTIEDQMVHFGGPVESGRGFVLHSGEFQREGTMMVDDSRRADGHDRHPARHRRPARGPDQAPAGAGLCRLGAGAARRRDPGQWLAARAGRRRDPVRPRFVHQMGTVDRQAGSQPGHAVRRRRPRVTDSAGLSIRDLSRPGLEPVSLSLDPGACLAVSGPSGAGKSLLLRAIADLDPNSGTIRLDGADRDAMPAPQWRRQVVYVPTEPGWWADSVADHFEDWSAAKPWIEALGLPADCGGWPIQRLSTGERQRLGLIRALVKAPAVLLLDEPTSGLDPDASAAVEAAIGAYRADNAAIIVWVTHDAAQAGRIAERQLTIESGQCR